MNLAKKVCAMLLALMLLLCVACGEGDATKPKKKKVIIVKKPPTTQTDEEEQEDDYEDSYYDDYDYDADYDSDSDEEVVVEKVKRELAEKINKGDSYTPEYTTSKVSWNGPTGYTIVYPDGNNVLKLSAHRIKTYFEEKAGISLNVVSDKTAATAKEILVGDTNRKKSNLTEQEFKISLSGDKLFFESGNFNGVMKSVSWFISFDYQAGFTTLLDGKYEFSSVKKIDGQEYTFTWGDDFDGNSIDPYKFHMWEQIGPYGDLRFEIRYTDEYVGVKDGRLYMTTNMVVDPHNSRLKYVTPPTVGTRDTMNFQYGYVEILVRYPFKAGCWPAWWGSSSLKANSPALIQLERLGYKYGNIFETTFGAEMDMFEYTSLTPAFHKWYFDPNTGIGLGNTEEGHSSYEGDVNSYFMEEKESYVYHVFGFEKTEKELKMFVDGNNFFTLDITKPFGRTDDMEDFKNPMFLMFQNHMQPDNVPQDQSSIPFEYKTEFIRLYQKADGGLWVPEIS